MKKIFFKLNLLWVFVLAITSWQCAEDPLDVNLSHVNLTIDTLTIGDISGSSYWVSPNLGSNNRLYLGTKNELNVPVSFIGITDHGFWDYYHDPTVFFDSLHFVLFSNDSQLTESSTPNLYFSPDSHFNESKSTYLDFTGFTTAEWTDLGQATVTINSDTSGIFKNTELKWDVLSLIETLADTLDSNLVRSFAINLANSDTNFIELFSREAYSGGDKDPQIKMFFHQTIVIDSDSTFRDTLHASLYSFGDVSIIDPGENFNNVNSVGLSNGLGLRSLVSISFDSLTLPEGALIRNAILTLPIDTSKSDDAYTAVFEPVNDIIDSMGVDTNNVFFETDPYTGVGYPYLVSRKTENGFFIISLKSFFQNIILGNESNIGFKIVPNEKNDPFEFLEFDLSGDSELPKLEIIYVVI